MWNFIYNNLTYVFWGLRLNNWYHWYLRVQLSFVVGIDFNAIRLKWNKTYTI